MWADLPRSAWAEQQDSGLLQVTLRLRCVGSGMSGLFTTSRPGVHPLQHVKPSSLTCSLHNAF